MFNPIEDLLKEVLTLQFRVDQILQHLEQQSPGLIDQMRLSVKDYVELRRQAEVDKILPYWADIRGTPPQPGSGPDPET